MLSNLRSTYEHLNDPKEDKPNRLVTTLKYMLGFIVAAIVCMLLVIGSAKSDPTTRSLNKLFFSADQHDNRSLSALENDNRSLSALENDNRSLSALENGNRSLTDRLLSNNSLSDLTNVEEAIAEDAYWDGKTTSSTTKAALAEDAYWDGKTSSSTTKAALAKDAYWDGKTSSSTTKAARAIAENAQME